MRIGDVSIGDGAPLALVSGLNVIESEDAAVACAHAVKDAAAKFDMPCVFKASFDKANRTRRDSYRGPGLDRGLRVLERMKRETGLPVLTDVHEPHQAEPVASVADALQIPAFLCRQTDLINACAATGAPLNVKKGPFASPTDMRWVVEKALAAGAAGVMITERGTSFGYNELVVDMRGLVVLRRASPVCFDVTHSVQRPGGGDGRSDGDRALVAPLARAAVAVGIDALFVEVHPTPDRAPCDGPCQLEIEALAPLLDEVRRIERALGSRDR